MLGLQPCRVVGFSGFGCCHLPGIKIICVPVNSEFLIMLHLELLRKKNKGKRTDLEDFA